MRGLAPMALFFVLAAAIGGRARMRRAVGRDRGMVAHAALPHGAAARGYQSTGTRTRRSAWSR